MAGYVVVANEGIARDRDLEAWLDLAVAMSAPSRPRRRRRRPKPRKAGKMMDIVKAALCYILPTFPLGFVWHLGPFKARYRELGIYRENVSPPLGLASMIIQGAIFGWAYVVAIAPLAGRLAGEGRDLCSAGEARCRGASRRWPGRQRRASRRSATS